MDKYSSKRLTLHQFKDKHFGMPGTQSRKQLETGYQDFKKRFILKNPASLELVDH